MGGSLFHQSIILTAYFPLCHNFIRGISEEIMGSKNKDQFLPLRFLSKSLLFAFLLIFPARFMNPLPSSLSESSDQKTLDTILEKTGDYCERVKNMALFYVCKEKVEDERYFHRKKSLLNFSNSSSERLKPRRTGKKRYTYDYQLVKKGKELKEKRILLEEDGAEKHEENVEFRPVKYFGKYVVYGPVGFLSKYWQQHFEYEIVGKDVVDGKKAIIVQSVPKIEREENCNYGRVWVDEKDFSILKIEYDPRSIKNYEDELLLSPIGDLRKIVNWTVTYGFEKKGVRFPSQQLVQEFYVNNEGQKVLMEKISFNYDDYKFFIVEVEVKY
jgi:hypothetical protein